jgi:hypothetical protein
VRDLLTFQAILQGPKRRRNTGLKDPEVSSKTSADIYKNTVHYKIQYNYLDISACTIIRLHLIVTDLRTWKVLFSECSDNFGTPFKTCVRYHSSIRCWLLNISELIKVYGIGHHACAQLIHRDACSFIKQVAVHSTAVLYITF